MSMDDKTSLGSGPDTDEIPKFDDNSAISQGMKAIDTETAEEMMEDEDRTSHEERIVLGAKTVGGVIGSLCVLGAILYVCWHALLFVASAAMAGATFALMYYVELVGVAVAAMVVVLVLYGVGYAVSDLQDDTDDWVGGDEQ